MKIGLFNKQELHNSKGEFIGYNLGYDYATEHESGIEGIRNMFGINQVKKNIFERAIDRLKGAKPQFGIKARTSTKAPSPVHFYRKGGGNAAYTLGFTSRFVNMDAFNKDLQQKLAWPGRKECFISCWDEEGVVLTTNNEEHFEALLEAIVNRDIAFYMGSKGFLSSGGLHMVIASKVDPEVDKLMSDIDEEAWELGKKADACGIEQKLIKANKKFRTLTPGWQDEAKTQVWFYMSPVDQKYASGWFTVEELELWAKEDRGPVLERKEKIKT